jgi:hypothetical protein
MQSSASPLKHKKILLEVILKAIIIVYIYIFFWEFLIMVHMQLQLPDPLTEQDLLLTLTNDELIQSTVRGTFACFQILLHNYIRYR